MKRPVMIFAGYLFFLVIMRLLLNKFEVSAMLLPVSQGRLQAEINAMLPFTILGGLISLFLILPRKSFKLFLFIYSAVWLFRIVLYLLSYQLGDVTLANKTFHSDLIINNYFLTISRLETPLPFIIFWLFYFVYQRYPFIQLSKNSF